MKNQEIMDLEDKVLELRKALLVLAPRLCERSSENYNYLGTLDVNLKTLRNVIGIVIRTNGESSCYTDNEYAVRELTDIKSIVARYIGEDKKESGVKTE